MHRGSCVDFVAGKALVGGDGVETSPERRLIHDLCGNEPGHLVSVADDRAFGTLERDHGATSHVAREGSRIRNPAVFLGGKLLTKVVEARGCCHDDAIPVGGPADQPLLDQDVGVAGVGQCEHIREACATGPVAFGREPHHSDGEQERIVGSVGERGGEDT